MEKIKQKQDSMLTGIRFIMSYVKKYYISLFLVIAFIIFATYLQVEAPKYLGSAIQDMTVYVTAHFAPGGDIEASRELFMESIYKLLAAFLLTAFSMFMYTFFMSGVAAFSASRIRETLFDKLQRLSIRFFDESNDGDVLSRFTNDIDNISSLLNNAFIQIAASVALVVAISYSMFKENVRLAFIVVGLAIIAMLFVMVITKTAKKYVNQQQVSLGELNGYIDEKVAGQKLIITTGIQEEVYNGFVPFNESYRHASTKAQAYSNMLFPLVNGFMLLSMASIIYVSSSMVVDGTMSVGILVVFIQYTQRFFQPLTQIVSQYNVFRLGITGASRVEEVLSEQEDVCDSETVVDLVGIEKQLEMKNVSFSYNADSLVLNDVNITVSKGEKVALVGPTGSGKTTVMNLLNRFYDLEEGEILIDGKNIKDLSLKTLRRNVGIVLQESVLFSGTIRENIKYGNDQVSDDKMIEAAMLSNIHEFILTLENGYDTHIDNSSSVFSVGQKQLICIARTIITNPDLLILDEATSNVDTVTEAKIQAAMNNVLKNRTSFVIAHRLKTIIDSDRIIVLKDGQVIEQGSHDQLLKEKGFYSELYHNQFVIEE